MAELVGYHELKRRVLLDRSPWIPAENVDSIELLITTEIQNYLWHPDCRRIAKHSLALC